MTVTSEEFKNHVKSLIKRRSHKLMMHEKLRGHYSHLETFHRTTNKNHRMMIENAVVEYLIYIKNHTDYFANHWEQISLSYDEVYRINNGNCKNLWGCTLMVPTPWRGLPDEDEVYYEIGRILNAMHPLGHHVKIQSYVDEDGEYGILIHRRRRWWKVKVWKDIKEREELWDDKQKSLEEENLVENKKV